MICGASWRAMSPSKWTATTLLVHLRNFNRRRITRFFALSNQIMIGVDVSLSFESDSPPLLSQPSSALRMLHHDPGRLTGTMVSMASRRTDRLSAGDGWENRHGSHDQR